MVKETAKPTLQLPSGFRWDMGVAKTDTAADDRDAASSSDSEEEEEEEKEVSSVKGEGIPTSKYL